MKKIFLKIIIWAWLFGIILLFSIAFMLKGNNSDESVFVDDFEWYSNNRQIASAYQTWDDGAVLKVLLETEEVISDKRAMRIEVIGPNKRSGSTIGSIYHPLPRSQRNWSSGSALRFWVKNPVHEPLMLTFNFKETYNEYWAVKSNGEFFLESLSGEIQKKDIKYGNLPIPAMYSGFVVIPFSSFSVPDWNTAWGNKAMDLNYIDTFSFGLTISNNHPSHFFLDDIQVIDYKYLHYLEIYRKNDIFFIPDEGEIRFQLNAYFVDPENQASTEIQPKWAIKPNDSTIRIDHDGWLTIPSGSDEREILISCEYIHEGRKYFDEFQISLVSRNTSASEITEMTPQTSSGNEYAETAGNRQLSPFDIWAYQNRPLFVIISISIVLILVILLSAFQKRI